MKYFYLAGAIILSIGLVSWLVPVEKEQGSNSVQISEILLVLVDTYQFDTLTALQTNLQQTFPTIRVTTTETVLTLPDEAYHQERNQYYAPDVLEAIHESFPNRPAHQMIIALMISDIYSGNLNFVFSSSHRTNKVGVVSDYRLGNEISYPAGNDINSDSPDYITNVIHDRLFKTTLRMVGGMVGLRANVIGQPNCAMNFSNTLAELDAKQVEWCGDDEERLRAAGLI